MIAAPSLALAHLEVARLGLLLAAERDLRWPTRQQRDNLLVRNLALLEALSNGRSARVACPILPKPLATHEHIGAGIIRLADVAVHSTVPIVTLAYAIVALARVSLLALDGGAA